MELMILNKYIYRKHKVPWVFFDFGFQAIRQVGHNTVDSSSENHPSIINLVTSNQLQRDLITIYWVRRTAESAKLHLPFLIT